MSGLESIKEESINALIVSSAGSDDGPGSFAESHPGPASCPLRHAAVYHHVSNGLFGSGSSWRIVSSTCSGGRS